MAHISLVDISVKKYEEELKKTIPDDMMFLDGEIINIRTFETVRKATDYEIECFYAIRLLELKKRMREREN